MIFLFNGNQLYAQNGLEGKLGLSVGRTTSDAIPFWLRSNRFGSVPLDGTSISGFFGLRREFDSSNNKLFDWGFGIDSRLNMGASTQVILLQAYGKARIGAFQIKAGRSADVMGLVGDTLLSSGTFSVSGNALGIPKVELSIPHYMTVPFTGALLSVKGNLAHGWLGDIQKEYIPGGSTATSATTFFHQKSFYARLGKPCWRLKLYGGFNHQAFWGDQQTIFGPRSTLSPLQTFKYVMLGKVSQGSKVGNHLGSIDMGLDYELPNVQITLYRQNYYEVGALYYLANIADGLNGIAIRNKNEQTGEFKWRRLLLEFLYTKNQAGYPWSRLTPSGDEDYYNNYIYSQGWSYKGEALGNPFLTPKKYAREGMASHENDYFINNRVVAVHGGMQGLYKSWQFVLKLSFSRNYGTFGTSEYGHSTGSLREEPPDRTFRPVNQFSSYLDFLKHLKNYYTIGFTAAVDVGGLYNNSCGAFIYCQKTF